MQYIVVKKFKFLSNLYISVMEYQGNIRKMSARLSGVIEYQLPVGKHIIDMNAFIGKEITLEYQGEINCIRCGRKTSKSFAQGYCYPCFTTAPETEECVLRPELCRAHEGISRDMEYARGHCLIEHIVYISHTSGLKVGVTRNTQIPTRWIDQGATMAVEVARTPNRYTAGLLEVALKAHMNDKTNWRKMLSGDFQSGYDLLEERRMLREWVPDELSSYLSDSEVITKLFYPVSHYPDKIKSLNFDKDPLVRGILKGIKGQYLMFDGGQVINIRKFGGYLLKVLA